jgi:hypothetical protein
MLNIHTFGNSFDLTNDLITTITLILMTEKLTFLDAQYPYIRKLMRLTTALIKTNLLFKMTETITSLFEQGGSAPLTPAPAAGFLFTPAAGFFSLAAGFFRLQRAHSGNN